jgi:4-hydroxy-tetrahydrodipicolinate synthase
MFSGSIPALVTPFRDGALDEAAFRRLVDWQIDRGSSALVPCGTTGESADARQRRAPPGDRLVRRAGGGPGAGDRRVRQQRHPHRAVAHEVAKDLGADAALMVAPYYNRPSQDGLLAHFSFLAESCDLPIVLYNVPGRTVTDLLPATVIELARRFPGRIVGIKDASGDLQRVGAQRSRRGAGFCQLRATTRSRSPATRSARSAASRSPPTSPRSCAPSSTRRRGGRLRDARATQRAAVPAAQGAVRRRQPGADQVRARQAARLAERRTRLPITALQ